MTQNPFDALGGAGGFDMNALLQQAQQMQEQLQDAQARLADTTVDGTVAGGAVTVTVNGVGELVGVEIRAGEFDGNDADDLADLGDMVVAAYRDAKAQADALAVRGPRPARGRPGRRLPGPSASSGGRHVRRRRPGPHRRARPAARRRAQERPADRLPPAPGRARRRTPPRRRADRGQGQGAFCSVCFNVAEDEQCRICRDPRRDPTRALRRRGAQGRRRDRAHPRVPRPLPRARRRDLADRRHRPRPAADPGAAGPAGRRRRSPR